MFNTSALPMQVLYFQCLLGGHHGVRPETAAYLCQRWAPQVHHHELAMRFLIQALHSYEVDQVALIHTRCFSSGAMVSPQAMRSPHVTRLMPVQGDIEAASQNLKLFLTEAHSQKQQQCRCCVQ